MKIQNIWRIENARLWRIYQLFIEDIRKYFHVEFKVKTDGDEFPENSLHPQSNEKFLFHGTKHENVDSIIANGASEKYASIDTSGYLGLGIYLGV